MIDIPHADKGPSANRTTPWDRESTVAAKSAQELKLRLADGEPGKR